MTSRLGEWYGARVPDIGILWGYMAFTVLGFRALVCATAIFQEPARGSSAKISESWNTLQHSHVDAENPHTSLSIPFSIPLLLITI